MRQRLSDYVADFLVKQEINHCFTVTGGGAMHLNDALGHKQGLTCVYNHHEQACAIAGEAYARLTGKIAAVCVTTGPGGTNALTGVVGAWTDSIPMLVISGQVRYDTTAHSTGLDLRAMGDQEYEICKSAQGMTKYCTMITDPNTIRYHLEKAFYLATTGRPGPCWIDIPVNFQGCLIETDNLEGFDCSECAPEAPAVNKQQVSEILEKISKAKRPVFNAGAGIRVSGSYDVFRRVADKLGIPVVTGWDSIDLIEDDHPLYTGRGGIMGDRAGNFAIQNSDLVFSVGSRLSIRQVGYNWKTWAREAFVIMNDVDQAELKKPIVHVDMPVWADALDLLTQMEEALDSGVDAGADTQERADWVQRCQTWKERYPVVLPKHCVEHEPANVYAFMGELGKQLAPGTCIVVGNGSACVVGSHAMVIKRNTRFLINSGIASMGYDLPAAIGAAVGRFGNKALNRSTQTAQAAQGEQNAQTAQAAHASQDAQDNQTAHASQDAQDNVVLITGDGSIQMNIQELQTIIHHHMPIKIFLINNQGYHSIRQTQTNIFSANFCGIGPESGDLSFPDMGKIAAAYGFEYYAISANKDLANIISTTLNSSQGPTICEVFVDTKQFFEPKSATKRLEDGSLYSPPLEDLAPFLPREEFAENMIIEPLSEQ